MANNRALLFYEMTLLIEKHVDFPCGIEDWTGQDEYRLDAVQFTDFFLRFWCFQTGWLSDDPMGAGWAYHGAGIVQNILLRPLNFIARGGTVLDFSRIRLGLVDELFLRERGRVDEPIMIHAGKDSLSYDTIAAIG